MSPPELNRVRVKIQFLSAPGLYPTRATPGSVGYDVRSAEEVNVPARGNKVLRTGIKVQAPDGWCLVVIPRSGMGKRGVTFANSVGLIDPDYGGELHVLLANHSDQPYHVGKGDRIGQLVVLPAFEIEWIEVTAAQGGITGRDGLGSTGR